jgi:hypothetical protein
MAAKKKAPSRKSAARKSQDTLIAAEYARLDREIAKKQAAKKALKGLAEYGGNQCFFSAGGSTTPSNDYPASRNGWRSAVQHAVKNTTPSRAMFLNMRCSDTPSGGGIPMAQCYWDSELKRASCGLEGSGGPHKTPSPREDTSLAGLPRKKAAKKAATRGLKSWVPSYERIARDSGFNDRLEWAAEDSDGMIPLMDTPYHSKAKDIAEACAAKKKGEYNKVWRVNSEGRKEICLAPLAGLKRTRRTAKSKR